jgi:hypothetical protein
MAIASAATGAVSAGIGVAKFFQGRSMQKKGEKFIENFEWQDLANPFENQQVSTMGRDFMQEQSNIGSATAVNALREGGQRALVGGLGRVEAARNDMNRNVATNLDTQQQAINTDIARQSAVNQTVMEKRQGDELQGYGQMINVGMGMKNQGLTEVVNGLGSIGASAAGGAFGGGTPAVSAASSLSPTGMAAQAAQAPTAGALGAGNSAFGKQYFQG